MNETFNERYTEPKGSVRHTGSQGYMMAYGGKEGAYRVTGVYDGIQRQRGGIQAHWGFYGITNSFYGHLPRYP